MIGTRNTPGWLQLTDVRVLDVGPLRNSLCFFSWFLSPLLGVCVEAVHEWTGSRRSSLKYAQASQ